MIAQLLGTLIKAVRGSKEGNRIGHMDGYWNPQASAGLPHRIEAGIIDLHQRTGRCVLTQIEPERLQNLQAARSVSMPLNDGTILQLRVIRPHEEIVRRLDKRKEPVGTFFTVTADGVAVSRSAA